jgi:hypothetical protein
MSLSGDPTICAWLNSLLAPISYFGLKDQTSVPADGRWPDRGSGTNLDFSHDALKIQASDDDCFLSEAKFQIEFHCESHCILP